MYLGIDVGGTKTLVAVLDQQGTIKDCLRFSTPRDYKDFIDQLAQSIDKLTTQKFLVAAIGIPATEMDRQKGVGVFFSNLNWRNVPIKADLEKLVNCQVLVENDAKLAGLSESWPIKDKAKVLYITVSTGIGIGLIVNHQIDSSIGDGGGRTLLIEHDGKIVPWESFASGKAIVERLGKRAEDIHDAKMWRIIADNIAVGLIEVIAMTQPDLIIIGGGVGAYLPRFIEPLTDALRRYENAMLPIPPIQQAKSPEEAVIYGCYYLAKAIHG